MDNQKAESAKALAAQRKNFAITNALRDNKARNVKSVEALLDMDKISLDDNGNLLGFDDQIKTVKSENSFLFDDVEQDQPKQVHVTSTGNPAQSEGKDPSKMTLDEQTALYKENPNAWSKLFKK